MGAVFGQKFGWERANWFATDGMEQVDDWSFRRSKWFEAIRKESANVTKAPRIDAEHINGRLAVYNPLRQLPACATSGGDAEAVTFIQPDYRPRLGH